MQQETTSQAIAFWIFWGAAVAAMLFALAARMRGAKPEYNRSIQAQADAAARLAFKDHKNCPPERKGKRRPPKRTHPKRSRQYFL